MGGVFRTAYNAFAWVWNHVWGTIFIGFGIFTLFNTDQIPWFAAPLGIGVGIYFYWSNSWSRAAEKAANRVYEKSQAASATPVQGGVVSGQVATPSAATPAESDPEVAKRIQIARIGGLAVIGVAFLGSVIGYGSGMEPVFYGLLGIGLIGLSVPGYLVRLLPKSRTTSAPARQTDAPFGPPAAWRADRPAAPDFPTPVEAAPVAAGPVAPRAPVSGLLIAGGVALIVIAGVGVGSVVSGVVYRPDSEPMAEESPRPAVVEPADPGEAPADPSDFGERTLEDLLGHAGEGGEPVYLEVSYPGGGEWFGGDVLLNFAIVGEDPADEYLVPLPDSTPCFIDSQRVSFPEYYKATYESADRRGMIVCDIDGVRELHVFTRGQTASASVAGGTSIPGDDIAATEGDTASFVQFVRDEGGSILINAEMDGERVYSRPSIMMMLAVEPFFDWAIPLADSYDYSIGDRPVTGYELFEYVCEQGLVRVDVVCEGDRISSINCWEE